MATTFYWIGGQGGTSDPNDAGVIANWATLADAVAVVAGGLPAPGDAIVVAVPAPLGGTGTLDDTATNFVANTITLSGTGAALQLSGVSIDAASLIEPAAAGSNVTIEIGAAVGQVDNAGSILVPGATDTLTIADTGVLFNTGLIRTGGGTLLLQDSGMVQNEGTIAAKAGVLVVTTSITGLGVLTITNGTLELQSGVSSASTLVFLHGTGELVIDASGGFAGGIVGFAPGETIDLLGITQLEPPIFNNDAATITDGTHTVTLDFPGEGFSTALLGLSSDGHGGTYVKLADTAEAVFSAAAGGSYAWTSAMPGAAGIDSAQGVLITQSTEAPFVLNVDTAVAALSLSLLTNGGTLAIATAGDGVSLADGLIDEAGTVALGGSSSDLNIGGALFLGPGGVVTVAGGTLSAAVITTPGTFANGSAQPAGVLDMTAGSVAALDGVALASVSLMGAASLNAGSGLVAVVLAMDGGAQISTGSLSLGTASLVAATIADSGFASINSLSLTADASLGVAGTLAATARADTVGSKTTAGALSVGGLTLTAAGLSVTGAAVVGPNGAMFDNASLSVGGMLTLDVADTLSLLGTSEIAAGTLAAPGGLSIDAASGVRVGGGAASAGTLAVTSGATAAVGALSIAGNVTVDSASALVVGVGAAQTGALVVAAGASLSAANLSAVTLDVEGSATLGAGAATADLAATTITGAGTLDAAAAITTIDTANRFASLIDLAGATLALTHAQMFTGTIDVRLLNAASPTPGANSGATATFDLRDVPYDTAAQVFDATAGIASLGTLAPFSVIADAPDTTVVWSIGTDDFGGTDLTGVFSSPDVVCYVAGTRLATPSGETPVEALRPGDAVLALEAGAWVARPVRWVGRTPVDLDRHAEPWRAAPIRIRAGAIARRVPARDLLVSPDHAILLGGVLVQAQALANGATILREPARGRVAYHHVELDRHAVLLAERLPAESYLDTGNRGWFAAEAGVRPLFLDFAAQRTWAEHAAAPRLADGAALARLRTELRERAVTLGYSNTDDAAPRLLAHGSRVRLTATGKLSWRARLPAGTRVLTLQSRSFVPRHGDPAAADDRRLGLPVAEITLDGRALPAAAWRAGWHAAEPGFRWSNGDATLVLPLSAAPSVLRISAVAAGQAYWAPPPKSRRVELPASFRR